MPQLLTANDMMMCPHGGQVSISANQASVKADSGAVLRPSDLFTISGCPFMTGTNPHPCVTVEWQSPASRVKVSSQVLTTASIGMCKAADQVLQGTVMVSKYQAKVSGQ